MPSFVALILRNFFRCCCTMIHLPDRWFPRAGSLLATRKPVRHASLTGDPPPGLP